MGSFEDKKQVENLVQKCTFNPQYGDPPYAWGGGQTAVSCTVELCRGGGTEEAQGNNQMLTNIQQKQGENNSKFAKQAEYES